MKKFIQILIPSFIATFFVVGLVWASSFPAALHNFSTGDLITADDWNALETTIGITNSADTSSHDYLIRQGLTISYASTTYLQISSTSPYKITALTNLTSIGSLITISNGYITASGFTGKSSTTAAFATAPTTCTAGNYPLGIDANGNAVSCTAAAGADGGSNWQFTPGQGAITPTSTIGIIVSASSTFGNIEAIGTITGGTIKSLGAASSTSITVNDLFRVNSSGSATSSEFTIATSSAPGGHGVRITISGATTTFTSF